jgi:hypothetical protein
MLLLLLLLLTHFNSWWGQPLHSYQLRMQLLTTLLAQT